MQSIISIKVIPRASKNEIVGWKEGVLRVRLTAVPEKGEANDALIAFLAKSWHLPKSAFFLVSGGSSRNKRVRVEGIIPGYVREGQHSS